MWSPTLSFPPQSAVRVQLGLFSLFANQWHGKHLLTQRAFCRLMCLVTLSDVSCPHCSPETGFGEGGGGGKWGFSFGVWTNSSCPVTSHFLWGGCWSLSYSGRPRLQRRGHQRGSELYLELCQSVRMALGACFWVCARCQVSMLAQVLLTATITFEFY